MRPRIESRWIAGAASAGAIFLLSSLATAVLDSVIDGFTFRARVYTLTCASMIIGLIFAVVHWWRARAVGTLHCALMSAAHSGWYSVDGHGSLTWSGARTPPKPQRGSSLAASSDGTIIAAWQDRALMIYSVNPFGGEPSWKMWGTFVPPKPDGEIDPWSECSVLAVETDGETGVRCVLSRPGESADVRFRREDLRSLEIVGGEPDENVGGEPDWKKGQLGQAVYVNGTAAGILRADRQGHMPNEKGRMQSLLYQLPEKGDARVWRDGPFGDAKLGAVDAVTRAGRVWVAGQRVGGPLEVRSWPPGPGTVTPAVSEEVPHCETLRMARQPMAGAEEPFRMVGLSWARRLKIRELNSTRAS